MEEEERRGEKKRKVKPFKRKKLHWEKGITLDDLRAGWTQCLHFLPKKKRLCNMQRIGNSRYCPVHLPEHRDSNESLDNIAEDGNNSANNKLMTETMDTQFSRVPCPIDPTHSIYSHLLEEHIKKCNAKRRLEQLEKEAYYCKGCNAGPLSESTVLSESSVDIDELRNKVLRIYDSFKQEIRPFSELISSSSEIPEDQVLKRVAGDKTSFSKVRHAQQDIHILNEMMKAKLLTISSTTRNEDEDDQQLTTFVELGAGKGMLGLSIAAAQQGSREEATESTQLILLERSGAKRRGDRGLEAIGFKRYLRIRVDLCDIVLSGLPGVSSEGTLRGADRVVLMAKHLCGVATDFSLRSGALLSNDSNSNKLKGVAIATCCHHACSWRDYVGQAFLLQHDISEAEFNVLKQWSGWAHSFNKGSAHPLDGLTAPESERQPSGSAQRDMSEVGGKVKRVLDQGRVEYLRALGFKAAQVQYCPPQLSPECYMLLAC